MPRKHLTSHLAALLILAALGAGAMSRAAAPTPPTPPITHGIVEYPIPTASSNPQYITVGPDGNLWTTEASANKIGRISTGGAVTEFPIPTAGSYPSGITTGPDGALWF